LEANTEFNECPECVKGEFGKFVSLAVESQFSVWFFRKRQENWGRKLTRRNNPDNPGQGGRVWAAFFGLIWFELV
jgi:hypothetical protein